MYCTLVTNKKKERKKETGVEDILFLTALQDRQHNRFFDREYDKLVSNT